MSTHNIPLTSASSFANPKAGRLWSMPLKFLQCLSGWQHTASHPNCRRHYKELLSTSEDIAKKLEVLIKE